MTTIKRLQEALNSVEKVIDINQELPTPKERHDAGFIDLMTARELLRNAIQDLQALYI